MFSGKHETINFDPEVKMELQIKNFGPIKEGSIDLSKRFDLFVGYNNSGKTYVAQMLWAIFHRSTINDFLEYFIKKNDGLFSELIDDKYEINKNLIDNLLREYSDYIVAETLPKIFNIKKDHVVLNGCSLKFILKDIKQIKESEIKGKVIIGTFADEAERSITVTDSDKKEFNLFEIEKKKGSLKIEIKENELDEDLFDYIPKRSFSQLFNKKKDLKKIIWGSVLRYLFNEKPFYLPASRLFYPVFYEYIFRYEKERREEMSRKVMDALNSNRKLEEKDFSAYKSRYTLPMDVLMRKIYLLNEEASDTSGSYNIFLKELESIIGGKILLDRKEDLAPIEFLLNLERDNNLEMYLASSSVNQLTTLYLFFKYWAENNENYLIMDEPEENLHPENQVNLINLLIKFAKMGNKVLITTHSPLLTKALNNHIYLGILKDKNFDIERLIEKEDIDIDPQSSLNPDEIGIYFFDGNSIHSYGVGEYGVLFSDFKAVEKRINNISEILTDQIYYLDSEDED
jgi:predicted ATP-dependent endonuclease of OLD family